MQVYTSLRRCSLQHPIIDQTLVFYLLYGIQNSCIEGDDYAECDKHVPQTLQIMLMQAYVVDRKVISTLTTYPVPES